MLSDQEIFIGRQILFMAGISGVWKIKGGNRKSIPVPANCKRRN
jgi:hypothetical protein